MRIAIAVLLLFCSQAYALTLEEAILTALELRGDVSSARSDLAGALWEKRQARLWFLPGINADLSFTRDYDVLTIEVPGFGSIPTGPEYTSFAGITASVPLFVAQGPAGHGVASAAQDMSKTRLRSVELDAAFDVVRAFYGVLLAEKMVSVSEEALSIAEEGFSIAQKRYDAGAISRFELLQSKVAWGNRKPEAIASRAELTNAAARLVVALGLPDSTECTLSGSLDTPLAVQIPASLQDARLAMESNNPDLAGAVALRHMGRAQVGLARASFFPSMVLQTSYGFLARREDQGFTVDDYERRLSATLAFSVPLFNGIRNIATYRASWAKRRGSDADAQMIEHGVSLSLVHAWNGLHEARERRNAMALTLREAQEAANIALASYEAGMITRLDMDQAFLALTASRTNHATALYHLRVAEGQVGRAMGTMLDGLSRSGG